jgi:predicted  nucleic acid-binding Zn-ribbon protein
MEPTDITIDILKSIRDEIRKTNERLVQTNDRLDLMRSELSERIDWTNERLDRLERRQTEADLRLSTEIINVNETMRELTVLIRDHLGSTLRDHERRITILEQREGV